MNRAATTYSLNAQGPRPVVLLVLAACVCLLAGLSRPASAATLPVTALPDTTLADGSVLELLQVNWRWRMRMRKRFRRHALRRLHRQRKKRRYWRKRRQRKKQVAAAGKKHHAKPRPVCIGGRVKARRCRCPGKPARYRIRRHVYVCARSGGRPVLPDVMKPGQGGKVSPVPAASASLTVADARVPRIVARDVLVTMRQTAGSGLAQAVARKYRLTITGQWPLDLINARLVRYRIGDKRSVKQVIAALRGEPGVVAPQPNYRYRAQAGRKQLPPADLQYALKITGVTQAHSLARGRGVRIAVIDSGIDVSHPDLAGAVEASFAAAGKAAARPGDHGTAIAGIIRARGMIRGVAPEAVLLDVNVFRASRSKRPATATSAAILRGLDWAVSRQARVINMSLAGPDDPLLRQAVMAAHRRRAIIVAAAGNGGAGGRSAYPAAYGQVIAVTATDAADRVYASANRGDYIAIAAPGVDVLAPAFGGAHMLQTGTSFAAAHVSGIIALMVGSAPKLAADAVLGVLGETAGDLGKPGRDAVFGAGRVNAFKSLTRVRKSTRTSQVTK